MLNLPSVGETAFKGVENIHYKSNQSNFERLNNDFKNFTRTNKDSFVKEASVNKEKINETNDGKFSFKVALKNFVKGVVSPLVIMAKHPVATLGTLIGIGVACAVAPVLGPILTVGFGAVSAWQLGKSTYNAISNYSKGKYDQAEKDCENVGQGFIGTVLTVLGLKQSAKVAAEAAIASPLLEGSLDGAQGVLINITGGRDMSLWDINEATEIISGAADENANIIFGAVIDENLDDEIRVTVIATGFKKEPPTANRYSGPANQKTAAANPSAGSNLFQATPKPSMELPPWMQRR